MEPSSANNICLDVIRHQQSKTPQPRESGNPGQAVLCPKLPPPSLKINEFGEFDAVAGTFQVPVFNWGTEVNCVASFFGRNGLAALGGELRAFVPTLPWGWTNLSQSHPRKTCPTPRPILLVDLHWGSAFSPLFPGAGSRGWTRHRWAALGRAVLPDPGREDDDRRASASNT